MKGTYGGLTNNSTAAGSIKGPTGSRPNIGGMKPSKPKVQSSVPGLPSSAYASFDTNKSSEYSAPAPIPAVTPQGLQNDRQLKNKKNTESINIVEEEISDENSVKAGSYRKSALNKTDTDRNLTTEEVLPSASERTGKMLEAPNLGYKINKKDKEETKSNKSGVSKYSAVPFTRPIDFNQKAPRDEAKDEESEDDYEDDFDEDFEPYETSNEEDANKTPESKIDEVVDNKDQPTSTKKTQSKNLEASNAYGNFELQPST